MEQFCVEYSRSARQIYVGARQHYDAKERCIWPIALFLCQFRLGLGVQTAEWDFLKCARCWFTTASCYFGYNFDRVCRMCLFTRKFFRSLNFSKINEKVGNSSRKSRFQPQIECKLENRIKLYMSYFWPISLVPVVTLETFQAYCASCMKHETILCRIFSKCVPDLCWRAPTLEC